MMTSSASILTSGVRVNIVESAVCELVMEDGHESVVYIPGVDSTTASKVKADIMTLTSDGVVSSIFKISKVSA